MISGIFYLFFLLALSITPSLIWLNYYLKKDFKPEPRRWLSIAFAAGVLITIIIGIAESALFGEWTELPNNQNLINIVFFLFLPFLEETGKFIATFFSSFKNPHFRDETTDPIIYAVVTGLGFAAAENLKVCFSILQENMVLVNWQNLASFSLSAPIINTLIITMFIRLLSAVFLHASSCSIFGYFWAIGRILKKKKYAIIGLLVFGIIMASLLHSC
ncbi:MAG TPA: PrsW family glutamic-type intramembrane protease, partial [Candidatus Paceibacterota bacterium]|nr:PrsW family glutamic-type intramembrane protease [Candidatus Paceibacterota bacterium]